LVFQLEMKGYILCHVGYILICYLIEEVLPVLGKGSRLGVGSICHG